MEYYIRYILHIKNKNNAHGDAYIEILYYLWSVGVVERNISKKVDIVRMITALELAYEKDDSAASMANFLIDIPHIEIIKDMKITEEKRETRRLVLYDEFPNFIVKEVPLSDKQIENYND